MNRKQRHSIILGVVFALLIFISCSGEKETSHQQESSQVSSIAAEGYIGDQECALCHAEIYRSFKQNGMGRSLYLPDVNRLIEDYQNNNQVYDKRTDLHYELIQKDSSFFQKEIRYDKNGSLDHELIYKVKYIIGSGNHTRSYLREENSFIYEMPVTWYNQEGKWDLSPSYNFYNQRFSRPIIQECMNCHNSYTNYVDHSVNQYQSPFPTGIGCERCHGPGANHVSQRLYQESSMALETEMDTTIVNPKYLSLEKQVDVCFQCHLQGRMTVFKSNKKQTDFRPGMSLSEVRSIFLDADQRPENPGIASQGARMLMSPCYQRSGGQLLCTTCHDPHRSIAQTVASSYSQACLSCHSAESLSFSTPEIDHRAQANCISCHMLKSETSDIPHVTGTDHWIRKRPRQLSKQTADQSQIEHEIITLRTIFEESGPMAQLRLGIAYVKYFEAKHNNDLYLERAIPLIIAGLKEQSDHSNGLFFLGKAYSHQGKFMEAEQRFIKLALAEPKHALALFELAQSQAKRGKFQSAEGSLLRSLKLLNNNSRAYNNLGNLYSEWNRLEDAGKAYERAIEIQPGYSKPYHNLGDLLLTQRQDVESALFYIKEALRLEPDFIQARLNLGVAEMLSGNDRAAIKAFERCLKLDSRFIPAHGNLAEMFIRAGNQDNALYHVQKILELQPNNKEALSMLKSLSG